VATLRLTLHRAGGHGQSSAPGRTTRSVLSRLDGSGYARDAVALLIDNLFAKGERRVFADTDPDNRASIALLTALGFILEGQLRAEWQTHIGIRDSLIYGLLAEEWSTQIAV
jgi:ribosomal-protein-alanine N-acetyltransferase